MVVLSDVMCDRVGLARGATAKQLLDYIGCAPYDILDGILTSEPSRIAAEESLDLFESYELCIIDQLCIPQDKYCSISFALHNLPFMIGLVSNEPVNNPPTDLENILFWALIDPRLQLQSTWRDGANGAVLDWRCLIKGKALIAEPKNNNFSDEHRRIVAALFALEHPELVRAASPPLASTASVINIGTAPTDLRLTQSRLLFEAASVEQAKWRCLSLYRILENAYLANIKQALLDEFDLDASRAIESAKKKIASELNQLLYLAERSNLIAEFDAFGIEIDALVALGNQYIKKVDQSAMADELYRSGDTYKKAVLRFYKLRCSIAHAGTSSVIYEQFSDANEATIALLPTIESIALKSLNISVVS